MAELIVNETSRVMNLSILPDLYRSDALSIHRGSSDEACAAEKFLFRQARAAASAN